jgi:hypothetical protein
MLRGLALMLAPLAVALVVAWLAPAPQARLEHRCTRTGPLEVIGGLAFAASALFGFVGLLLVYLSPLLILAWLILT